MNLGEWLKAQNLEALADVLRAHDIDLDVLPDLTDQDLERLGISLGQRRRLLKAASALATAPGTAAASQPATPPSANTTSAERRQVTVMFCDLVGSTELSARLDPEDMRVAIRTYQDACAGAIARFDGFLAKLMGDGVLAYFGFPHAYEDAAERAVRAALAIAASAQGMVAPDGTRLTVRSGIATGLVVVGDIVGTGVAREQSIVGETPNLAARLQGVAGPGEIVVSQSTQRLLGRVFELDDCGVHALKGFAQPVPVWRVRGESAVARRFAAARAGSTVPFVGREHEMGLLLERWQLAAAGEGQVVLLSGEAGIGKSRLAEALRERSVDSAVFAAFQCSPHHTNTALYPMIRYLEIAAGFSAEDSALAKLKKLEAFLVPANAGGPALVSLLGSLMSLPLADQTAVPEMTPAQRKAATLAGFIEHMVQVSAYRPVLFLLEDAHWIDPTSAELMGQLIDAIQAARILVIVTARPDFVSPWTGRAHATHLTLSRLGRAQCAEMVAAMAAAHAIPPEVREDIVAKTDGVPLFVEELTRTILEASAPERAAVPATLQDSLMARLDRLGDARDIAQIAAVIGRQFSTSLLAAVAPVGASALDDALAKLVKSEIVFPQRQAVEDGYSFKHALMRDAAYDSLLRQRRHALHERIARALEERFPAIVAEEPALLAHHYAAAGMAEPASLAHERAGDQATARSAYKEAVAHFEAALRETRKAAAATDRELALLLKLHTAIVIQKGAQSPEAADVSKRAYILAKELGDGPDLFRATWNLWLGDNLGRRTDAALSHAEDLVALGHRLQDDDLLLEAIHCRWSTALFHGDYDVAFGDSREGIRRYDSARHHGMTATFGGHDPGVCAHSVLALTYAFAGHAGDAQREIGAAIALAEKLHHQHTLAHAYINAIFMYHALGERLAMVQSAERVVALAEKYDFPPQRTIGRFFLGWARADDGDIAAGLALMESEFAAVTVRAPPIRSYAAMLAEMRLRAGRAEEALQLVERTLAAASAPSPDLDFHLATLLRVQRDCRARLGLSDNAPTAAVSELVRSQATRLAALKAAVAQEGSQSPSG